MMRLVLFFLLLWPLYPLQGQAPIEIIAEETALSCPLGGRVQTAILLRNPSNREIMVQVEQKAIHLAEHQQAGIEWGKDAQRLASGAYLVKVQPHGEIRLKAYFSAGFRSLQAAEVRYRFTDPSSHREIASVHIDYAVEGQQTEALLYESHEISISSMHPNPVVSDASFSYHVAEGHDGEARIVIFNVLGKEMGQYALHPHEHMLALRFQGWKPGVYFYTLMIGEESVITKKFILKR